MRLRQRLILAFLVLIFVASAILGILGPAEIHSEQMSVAPNWKHLFGTDVMGRDILYEIVRASFLTIGVAGASTFVSLILGCCVGFLVGWKSNQFLRAIIEALNAIPQMLLVFLWAAMMGLQKPVFENPWRLFNFVVFAIGLSHSLRVANWFCGVVQDFKVQEFHQSLRALGATDFYIFRTHLFGFAWPSLKSVFVFLISSSIVTEAVLGSFGIGLRYPMTSWGSLLLQSWKELAFHPWIALAPGLAIGIITWLLRDLTADSEVL